MNSDPSAVPVLNPTQALLAVCIITTIPVILFALWSEYFKRYLTEAAAQKEPVSREAELGRIRSAGVFGLLIQVGLFFSAFEIRRLAANPMTTFLPIVALSLQTWIQANLEKTLFRFFAETSPQKTNPTPGASPTQAAPHPGPTLAPLRAFFWSMVAASIYLGVLGGGLTAALLIGKWFSLPPLALGFTMIGFTAAGVLGGLWLNFVLSPFYLKKVFKTRSYDDADTVEFYRKKLPRDQFEIRVLGDESDSRLAVALMTGIPGGQRWFGNRGTPTLFLTEALLHSLNPAQVRAVIAHELAHLRLRHLPRRVWFSTAVIVGVSFLATILVFVAHLVLQDASFQMIGLLSGAGAFVVAFRLLGENSRAQEVEADIFTIKALGVPFEEWAQTLRKLDQQNALTSPLQKGPTGVTHLPTENRIERIRTFVDAEISAALKHEIALVEKESASSHEAA